MREVKPPSPISRRPTARARFFMMLVLLSSGACQDAVDGPKLTLVVARNVADAESFSEAETIEFRDCPVRQDQPEVEYRSPLGSSAHFWIDPASRLELKTAPAELLLTAYPTMGSDEPEIVVVRARYADMDQKALVDYRTRHRNCQILISVDGEIRWVEPNGSNWSNEIPIGVFLRNSTTMAAILDGDWESRWVEWPELEAAILAMEGSQDRALRMLACDPEFRAEFEQANPGALAILADQLAGFDCEAVDR